MLMQHRSPVALKSVGFYSTEPCLRANLLQMSNLLGKSRRICTMISVFTGHFRCCNGFPRLVAKIEIEEPTFVQRVLIDADNAQAAVIEGNTR